MTDELFHAMSRAVQGQLLFRRDSDYKRYLGLLQLTVERHEWQLHTFALMPNHVHLAVAAARDRISNGFQWLHWNYARHYVRTYRPRIGHVFGGPPKVKVIADDPYYLAVARYIALNPVGVLVDRPEDYRWSAHRALIGGTPTPPLLAEDGPLGWFGSVDEYERFVTGVEPTEYGAVRRWAGNSSERPDLATLLLGPKPDAFLTAHLVWGYPLRAIAEAAGTSYSAVQRAVRRARAESSALGT